MDPLLPSWRHAIDLIEVLRPGPAVTSLFAVAALSNLPQA
jgi:hypothetical protein